MVEVEITEIPPLTPTEESVVNGHSLLNVYNVVRGELELLGLDLANNPRLFASGLAECEARVERLSDPALALHDAARAHELKAAILREIEAFNRSPHAAPLHRRWETSRERIDTSLWILLVRAQEFIARATAPQEWIHVTAEELLTDLQELLLVMEKNSRGRYRFVYNLALQQPNDYYVDLRFESARGAIVMPPILKDVIRDLIANARKYTAPGGQVRAALHSSPDGVHLVVEDTGCGIPAAELGTVVHYGQRGSNVSAIRTLGAGCGLTKAVLATQQLGGRFWIASEEESGTRIRLWIPRHASEQRRATRLCE